MFDLLFFAERRCISRTVKHRQYGYILHGCQYRIRNDRENHAAKSVGVDGGDEPHKDDHPAVMYLGVFHRGYPEPGLFLFNDGLT